jgi:hypothetical protein
MADLLDDISSIGIIEGEARKTRSGDFQVAEFSLAGGLQASPGLRPAKGNRRSLSRALMHTSNAIR